MSEDHGRTDELLGEAEFRRILARAAAIDSRGDAVVTTDEARRIAIDAGISPRAIDLALLEAARLTAGGMTVADRSDHRAAPSGRDSTPAATTPAAPFWKRALRPAALVAAGAALAVLIHAVDPRGMGRDASLLYMGATAAFAAVRGLTYRGRGRSLAACQTELGLVLGAFAAAIGALQGPVATEVALIWWGLCALAGTGIVRLTLRAPEQSPAGGPSPIS
jgi:hypothetical protein